MFGDAGLAAEPTSPGRLATPSRDSSSASAEGKRLTDELPRKNTTPEQIEYTCDCIVCKRAMSDSTLSFAALAEADVDADALPLPETELALTPLRSFNVVLSAIIRAAVVKSE